MNHHWIHNLKSSFNITYLSSKYWPLIYIIYNRSSISKWIFILAFDIYWKYFIRRLNMCTICHLEHIQFTISQWNGVNRNKAYIFQCLSVSLCTSRAAFLHEFRFKGRFPVTFCCYEHHFRSLTELKCLNIAKISSSWQFHLKLSWVGLHFR